jgi:hypothetical protein
MTVASETILESHACNGTTGPFAFNFKIFDNDDLLVIKVNAAGVETELTKDAAADGYTVAMDGAYPNTGEITLTDAYDATNTLKIILWPDLLQGTSLPSTGVFSTKEVEYAMDKLCKQVQKLYHLVSRAPTFLKSSSSSGIGMLPEPEANKTLGWNPAANALENKDVSLAAASGSIVNAAAAYTVGSNLLFIFCTGTFTLTLSPAANGYLTWVCNKGAGVVTVQAEAGDTIEGAAQILLAEQYKVVALKGDGVNTHVRM